MPLERERILLLDFLFSSQRFSERLPCSDGTSCSTSVALPRLFSVCSAFQHFMFFFFSSSVLRLLSSDEMRLSFVGARETVSDERKELFCLTTSEVCAFFINKIMLFDFFSSTSKEDSSLFS